MILSFYIIDIDKSMKKFSVFLAMLLCVVISSCDECDDPMYGGWPPVEVDKQQLEFTSAGGEQTVTALNYDCWWICVGYEKNGSMDYADFVNVVWPKVGDSNTLDGGWYRVTVPRSWQSSKPGEKNIAVVVVDENSTGKPRCATIEMSVGNVSTAISVNQQ